MKLTEIYKFLKEDSEHKVRKGRKLITIECNDSQGELEKFLMWWKSMGDIGHSATVHCDVDNKSDIVKVYCDGDGADRTYSITVKMLPDEN
jgi:hypothetical protein